MSVAPNNTDTPYARLMARIVGRRIVVLARLRTEAIQRLELQPGNRVIDAGCGTGASFSYLLNRVGPSGEVVGIEIDPFLAGKARDHVQLNGWKNARLIQSAVQTATLDGEFDALLLFATHEILTSTEALDHLFSYLTNGARVVAFGARQIHPPLGWIFNPLFRLASKKWLPNSTPIDTQPWRLLIERLAEPRVVYHLVGLIYLVSGRRRNVKDQ